MLKVIKNNSKYLERLQKVLSGELPENDAVFREWLCAEEENREFYAQLCGRKKISGLEWDKDRMFENITEILSLRKRKNVPFFQRSWFRYAASVAFLVLSAMAGISYYSKGRNTNMAFVDTPFKKSIFEPGTRKAYLQSSDGGVLDLSKSFEVNNSDGSIVLNDGGGLVSFQKKKPRKNHVERQTLYVPKGGEYELLLSDGTKVYLNSGTRLVFPSYFEGDERVVELSGEAYFEVKKDVKPFIVKTENYQIEVLGTTFNVDAYNEDSFTSTTLVEGSVKVHVPHSHEVYTLQPREQLNLDKKSEEISINQINTEVYTAWVRGEFIFRNQSLNDIFLELTRWYDFSIEYKNPSIKKMRFTGSAEKVRPLDYLLNQICQVTDIKYQQEGDKIILY